MTVVDTLVGGAHLWLSLSPGCDCYMCAGEWVWPYAWLAGTALGTPMCGAGPQCDWL